MAQQQRNARLGDAVLQSFTDRFTQLDRDQQKQYWDWRHDHHD